MHQTRVAAGDSTPLVNWAFAVGGLPWWEEYAIAGKVMAYFRRVAVGQQSDTAEASTLDTAPETAVVQVKHSDKPGSSFAGMARQTVAGDTVDQAEHQHPEPALAPAAVPTSSAQHPNSKRENLHNQPESDSVPVQPQQA